MADIGPNPVMDARCLYWVWWEEGRETPWFDRSSREPCERGVEGMEVCPACPTRVERLLDGQ